MLIVGMTVCDVNFGALFVVVVKEIVIKVFAMSKVFVIVKRVGHGGLDEFDTVFEWCFIESQVIGGIILLVGVSLKWTDEEAVVRILIIVEFFFDFGESFGACFNHFDLYK